MKTEPVRWLTTQIASHIWKTKYRHQEGGVVLEQGIEESWGRVAHALASVEVTDQEHWEKCFYEALEGFHFLPGGRILAGAGTGHRVTLFNCFVMGLIEDDMESIFNALKEGALTMQAGGGVGYDFSSLRPRGSRAHASDRIASGPVSFMRIWNTMCGTILSTGARRGAMIASLRCDHPDIETFIEAKRGPGQLRHFNLSVQVSNAFMAAVEDDTSWPLVFPEASLNPDEQAETIMREWPGYDGEVACRVMARHSARKLWQNIMRATYDVSEPGVLFVDRINQMNNLSYRERITTTNPCGEIPLPPYGACNLGCINLTQFVQEPFTEHACIDDEAMRKTTELATRMLDNVIDLSWFPLRRQREQAQGSRRIGLGITGLADALIMLGLNYGDANARAEAARMMELICHAAYRCSIQLAREKGTFPFFEKDAFLASPFVQSLPGDIKQDIARHGIRNSHLTAIAPTGTISLLANNVSSGIEPVFDLKFTRNILNSAGMAEPFDMEDYAYRFWRQQGNSDKVPDEFVVAQKLSSISHIKMQAALQTHVDSAISKTIHVPESCAFEEFQHLYREAYDHGLKGCTTFRTNPITGHILGTAADRHCCSIEREGE